VSSKFMRFRLGRRWWWVFSILIACPALVLALLGLRAIRSDRIERELQLRDRQTQTARLADAAIQNAVEHIAAQLDRLDVDLFGKPARVTLVEPGLPVFVLDGGDVLSFPLQRVYFGEIGRRPEFLKLPGDLSTSALQAAAQALTMEAQHRNLEAIALYQQARQNPGLRDWADLALDRLNRQTQHRLADPRRARSESYTPGGVPVAIVASSAVEQVAAEDRPRFAPLLDQTIANLRADLWWLSYEQRGAYDAALQRWLQLAGTPATTSADERLAEVEHSHQAIRRSGQHVGGPPRLETETGQPYLIVWSRTSRDSVSIGAVLSGGVLKGFFNSALQPLLKDQPFAAALRPTEGAPLWNALPDNATAWRTEQLSAVPGLRMEFTGPHEMHTGRDRWMWYGFVLLPMLMLVVGLTMTVRVVRQEIALNQMQSKFIAAVSHELKSPITGIRLLMERIKDGRLQAPEMASEYYQAIGRETDRLENLVNRLLESQKLQSEARKYAFEPTSLEDLADNAVRRLRPQAEAKGIQLAAHAEKGVPNLPLDKAAIGDAIENLLDNAIKYSPAGSQVSLHIRAADNEAQVEVCDQGIGIEKTDLPRIFDPFFRGCRGDKESVKGTGLGLALVKAAAEAHGGAVDVSTAPESGSRFTLRLPLGERR
jgi:signal transduction histidine kinase